MAEAIHCPSCTTRYRLRPERLKPVTRRAKCLSCGGVFPVGDVVQRLLQLPAPNSTAGFEPEVVESIQVEERVLDPVAPEDPSLTLGDLEDMDAEILEKTLVAMPTDLPEEKVEHAPEFPPEITEATLSGYTSARDAIEKLFRDTPAAGMRVRQDAHAMDMEAALSALDSTLGTSAPVHTPEGDHPTASGLSEEDLAGPSTSTMRLSQEDLQAVLDAAPPLPATPAEPTVALRASDFAPHQPPAPRAPAPVPDPQEGGPEQLRLRIGEEIYSGLTMPQLIAWVEEGRILENHLVARQHSENWLEAHKVPGLRPVFERLRRERSGGAPSLDSGIGDGSPKKGLFGGLFGKG